MEKAVNSTEKIRQWNEHTLELNELEDALNTKIFNEKNERGY